MEPLIADPQDRKVHRLAGGLVAVTACAMPWFFGGYGYFVAPAALAIFCLALLVALFAGFGARPRSGTIAALLISVLAISWLAIQAFVPPQSVSGLEASVSPSATRSRLALLVLGIASLVCGLVCFGTIRGIRFLFGMCAVNGALLAFFGIVQKLGWNGKVYWTWALPEGGLAFGPWFNRNNAAGYLLLTLACAVFFVAHRLCDDRMSGLVARPQRIPLIKSIARLLEDLWIRFGQVQARELFQYTAVVLIATSILVSLSRGGMVALAVLLFVAGILFLRQSRTAWVLIAFLVILGGGFAVWAGQFDRITERVETLSALEDASPARVTHWQDVTPYLRDYWVLGSGAGTYRYVYPRYLESTFADWFHHAENQYIETLAETGVVGMVLLLAMLGTILGASAALMRRPDATSQAAGICGLSAVAGQIVAAAFDFGLFLPANAVLMGLVCGALLGRLDHSWLPEPDATIPHVPRETVRRGILLPAFLVLIVAISLAATVEFAAVESVRLVRHRLDRVDDGTELARDLDATEYYLVQAKRIRPLDPELWYEEGRLHAMRYRQVASAQLLERAELLRQGITPQQDTSSSSSATPPTLDPRVVQRLPADEAQAWPLTNLASLNRAAWSALRENPASLEELKAEEAVRDHLSQAWTAWSRSADLFALDPRPQFELAQLSILFEDPPRQSQRLQESLDRWPTYPPLLYSAGLIEHHAGNIERSVALWHNCMSRSRKFDQPIIDYATFEMPARVFFGEVLPQDPEFLFHIARTAFGNPEQKLARNLLLVHTGSVLEKDSRIDPARRAWLMAEIDFSGERPQQADAHFRKALELAPDQTEWRLRYVEFLQHYQDFAEAARQLSMCSAMGDQKLQRTIRRLSTRNLKALEDPVPKSSPLLPREPLAQNPA